MTSGASYLLQKNPWPQSSDRNKSSLLGASATPLSANSRLPQKSLFFLKKDGAETEFLDSLNWRVLSTLGTRRGRRVKTFKQQSWYTAPPRRRSNPQTFPPKSASDILMPVPFSFFDFARVLNTDDPTQHHRGAVLFLRLVAKKKNDVRQNCVMSCVFSYHIGGTSPVKELSWSRNGAFVGTQEASMHVPIPC